MILKEKNRKDSESKMQISQGGVTRPSSQFESYSLSASSKSYSGRSYSAPKPDYDLFLTGNAWLHSPPPTRYYEWISATANQGRQDEDYSYLVFTLLQRYYMHFVSQLL